MDEVGRKRLWDFYYQDRWDFYGHLDEYELAHLIRVFTLLELEEEDRGGMLGSTARIHHMLAQLRSKNRALASELEVWAFHTTNNSYVPYGVSRGCTAGARSIEEYNRLIQERNCRNGAILARQREFSELLRRIRSEAHQHRLAKQRQAKELRDSTILSLLEINEPIKRAEVIAMDQRFPIWYFPDDFADIVEEEIRQLSPELLALLKNKLARANRGKWSDLRRMVCRL